MTPDDERYMKVALDEARRAMALDEVPIGAVVVCRGRIIARAHNLTETLTDVTAHAEMQAITAAANYLGGKYLTDCTLYVTVEPPHVRWSAGLEPVGTHGLWRKRRKTGLSHPLRGAISQENRGRRGCARCRVRPIDDRFFQGKTIILWSIILNEKI